MHTTLFGQNNKLHLFFHRNTPFCFTAAAFFAIFLLFFSLPCIGSETPSSNNSTRNTTADIDSIRVGLYDNAPKIFIDENGNAAGFWPDIIRHIAKQEGWEVKWVPGSWSQGLARLTQNQIDIMPDTAWTKSRSRRFSFSRETVVLSWSRLYTAHGIAVDSILDLEGKTIGGLAGSFNLEGPEGLRDLVDSFEIDCTIVEMESYTAIFQALDDKEIDAGITNKDFGNRNEHKYDVTRSPLVFQPARLLFALTTDAPRTAQLIEILDQHIRKLKGSNQSIYYQALDHWLGDKPAKSFLPRWIPWLLVGGALVLFLLILGTIVLNAMVRAKTKSLQLEIEARRQAEGRERHAKNEWRQIFQAIGQPAMLLAPDHHILAANHAALQATNCAEEELIGQKCHDIFHHTSTPPQQCPARAMKVSGHIETEEMEVEGLGKTFMVSCTPIYNERDEFEKIIHIASDINQYKTMERQLKSSERQLRAILENVALIAIMLDQEGNLVFCNDYFLTLTGWQRSEIIGNNWFTICIPEDHRDQLIGTVFHGAVTQATFPVHYQNDILLKNGERRTIKWNNTLYHYDDGTVVITAIGEDITDLLASQQALQAARDRFKELVETIKDVVYATDDKGVITYISPLIESLTGWPPEQIIGKHLENFVDERDLASIHNQFTPHLQRNTIQNATHGHTHPGEYRFITHAGERVWVKSSSQPIFEEGAFVGLRGIIIDITETRELQGKLQHAQKMESIGTLAGGIAHDFNNILSAVIGFTELSLTLCNKGTNLHEYLTQVLEAGNRAKNLTSQILSISRHEEHAMKPVQIRPLVKEALKMMRSTIPTSITIKKDISKEDLVVHADPTQIHQVIVNLVTNAMQAMEEREGVVEIRLHPTTLDKNVYYQYPTLAPGEYAHLTVSDTGKGIAQHNLDKVFEPYFTTKKRGEGTGLGLSVVHSIVTAHRGHISVYSQPGTGTTFHVLLPLIYHKASTLTSLKSEQPLATGDEHILLVDDEQPIVKMQQLSLQHLGYTVTATTSSEEALELFRNSPDSYDLVITDMSMPRIPGNKLAAAIKEIKPHTPIILCTGFAENTDAYAQGPGINGFLMKPVDKTKMADLLRKLLDTPGISL